jgi:uncharacterized protein YukE
MADFIQVDPADLLISGRVVDCHAEDMHAAHTEADARIEGALTEWVGSSLAVMSAKAGAWQAATAPLHQRMSDHAYGLTATAVGFEDIDDDNADRIHAVGLQAGSGSLGDPSV